MNSTDMRARREARETSRDHDDIHPPQGFEEREQPPIQTPGCAPSGCSPTEKPKMCHKTDARPGRDSDPASDAKSRSITLYHFTGIEYLPAILEEGIRLGDVATSWTGGFNAPWLTRNPDPAAQGWARVDDDALPIHLLGLGRGAYFADKGAVCLTVEVPASDSSLVHWPPFARRRVARKMRRALEEHGGNGADWYIYRGAIPVAWITQVEPLSKAARALGEAMTVEQAREAVTRAGIPWPKTAQHPIVRTAPTTRREVDQGESRVPKLINGKVVGHPERLRPLPGGGYEVIGATEFRRSGATQEEAEVLRCCIGYSITQGLQPLPLTTKGVPDGHRFADWLSLVLEHAQEHPENWLADRVVQAWEAYCFMAAGPAVAG